MPKKIFLRLHQAKKIVGVKSLKSFETVLGKRSVIDMLHTLKLLFLNAGEP